MSGGGMDLLERFGVLRMARYFTRKTPRILMYHRFAEVSGHRYLGADVFEQQLVYLKKHFTPLPLDQVVAGMQQGRLPSNAVAITIDDCYTDFYTHAWPLLKKYDIPATLYAVTDF